MGDGTKPSCDGLGIVIRGLVSLSLFGDERSNFLSFLTALDLRLMVLSAVERGSLLVQLKLLLKKQEFLLLHGKLGPLNSVVKAKILSIFAVVDGLRASLCRPCTLSLANLSTAAGQAVLERVKLLGGGAGAELILTAATYQVKLFITVEFLKHPGVASSFKVVVHVGCSLRHMAPAREH